MTRGGKRRGAGRPPTIIARRQVKLWLPAAVHRAMVETKADGESINEYGVMAIAAEATRRKDEA